MTPAQVTHLLEIHREVNDPNSRKGDGRAHNSSTGKPEQVAPEFVPPLLAMLKSQKLKPR